MDCGSAGGKFRHMIVGGMKEIKRAGSVPTLETESRNIDRSIYNSKGNTWKKVLIDRERRSLLQQQTTARKQQLRRPFFDLYALYSLLAFHALSNARMHSAHAEHPQNLQTLRGQKLGEKRVCGDDNFPDLGQFLFCAAPQRCKLQTALNTTL
jgi:hypothetical protein